MPPQNQPPHADNLREQDRRKAIQEKLSRMEEFPAGPFASGFDALDSALHGGFPRGRIVEIFGPPASGKTTFALQIASNLQRTGNTAVWVDADRSFDPVYAAALGVRLEALTVVQPDTAESAMAMVRQLAESHVVELIIVDSAAALAPALELEAEIGSQSPGLHARVLASGLRTLARIVLQSGATLLLLNPSRDDHDSAAGAPVKLHSWLRIGLSASTRGARFRIVKNKAAGGLTEGEIRWHTIESP